MGTIVALIIAVSLEMGVPPNFVLAVAYTENSTLNPRAINRNSNGTTDRGVMQLNDRYFPIENWWCEETNIRTAVRHIKELSMKCTTWWEVAVAYNAGFSRVENPPLSSVNYASRVMELYTELEGGYVRPVIR